MNAALAALLLVLSAPQAKEADDTKKDAKKDSSADEPKTVAEIVERCDRIPGLFDLYRQRKTGSLYALIRPDQLDREFIHFTYTENGVARVGHFRGNFRGSRVFVIERDHQRLRFVVRPTSHHFDPKHALARAADANISPAVLAAPKIVAEGTEKDGDLKETLAVNLGGMFLKELWHQVKPSDSSKSGSGRFTLGSLSDERTRFNRIRNYPENTDIVVDYTYASTAPKVFADREDGVVDSRYVTITLQHSLIAMPGNGYRPRLDDERVGYFTTRVDDMTSTAPTPWRDLVHRWDLRKKDPEAPVSEPVTPIVFWIENTTPVAWRDTIREAGLRWNAAFEAAGFRNAVQIRQQPDDAEWDAGDIRYNVLRWTSSPDPPFGGYGPSFVNPRTGQILGADIMLEWIYVTNRIRMIERYADTADPRLCNAGHHAHHNAMAGLATLRAFNAPDVEEHRLLTESLFYLVLHEIGHTLGLNHNMAASTLHGPGDIHDAARTARTGLTGSVMDYPAVNLAAPGTRQGQFFTDRPGPYDLWAITFGYSPDLEDPAAREALLSRSGDPRLIFGNDADDMRSSSRGIDPRVNINDLSGDPLEWSASRLRLVERTLANLLDRYAEKGRTDQELRDAYFNLQRQRRTCASVVSRFVGGVHVDRSAAADAVAYTPVDEATQKRAMRILSESIFAPGALVDPKPLLAQIRARRRGFGFFPKSEDPRLHDSARSIHSAALDHLMHGNTLERMTNARLYGNTYSVSSMLSDLTRAVFEADLRGPVHTIRQNLQVDYVERLIRIAGIGSRSNGFDDVARSAATWQLTSLLGRIPDPLNNPGADTETRAHHRRLRLSIENALKPGR